MSNVMGSVLRWANMQRALDPDEELLCATSSIPIFGSHLLRSDEGTLGVTSRRLIFLNLVTTIVIPYDTISAATISRRRMVTARLGINYRACDGESSSDRNLMLLTGKKTAQTVKRMVAVGE